MTRNKFYYPNTSKLFTDEKSLRLKTDHQHHDLTKPEDYSYLTRCVERFNNLGKDKKLVFVMIQPLYISNCKVDNSEYSKLYNVLTKKFGITVKLLIFNMVKLNNEVFNEEIIGNNIQVYELESKISKGSYGMQWYDEKGVNKLLEIVKNACI